MLTQGCVLVVLTMLHVTAALLRQGKVCANSSKSVYLPRDKDHSVV